jgi:fatty-acyl-CoA synthase
MRPPFSRTLFDLIEEQAGRSPDSPAVIHDDNIFSYSALAERSRRVAAALALQGIRRGDAVAILISNRIEWLECCFGAHALGAVVVPLSTWSTSEEIGYLLRDSEASILISLDRLATTDFVQSVRELNIVASECKDFAAVSSPFPKLRQVVIIETKDGPSCSGFLSYKSFLEEPLRLVQLPPGHGVSAGDDALILYTSGSSSKPKAVRLTQSAIIENAFNIGERQGLGPNDRVLLSPPLFWAYGGINAMPATFTHGATLVLQTKFEAGEALGLIEKHGCTSIYTLPGMTSALIAHPDFSRKRTRTLRTGLTIGSPQDIVNAAERLGASEICNIYGASETYGNCCVTEHSWPLERRSRCQGEPLPGMTLRIVDVETGAELPRGTAGLVEVRGYIFPGYGGASANQNAKAFTPDGFFRTGDEGSLNEDGTFSFLSRTAEMIKRAGINVAPAEIEEVLLRYSGVSQVGVVGVPDERRGQIIVAFIIAEPNAKIDESRIVEHCRRVMSRYKVPDIIKITDSLPVTVTGKLMRRELVEQAKSLAAAEGKI